MESISVAQLILAFIATIPATLGAIAAFWVSIRNNQVITQVHTTTMEVAKQATSLNSAVLDAAKTEGHTAGVAEEKARNSQPGALGEYGRGNI